MRTLIVIPARLNSQRLPRKLLLAETGKPLLQYVVERGILTNAPNDLIVAADCKEMLSQSGTWGVVTGEHHNGTSRAADALKQLEDTSGAFGKKQREAWEKICIVQADYPEIPPALIDAVINGLEQHPEWDCATAAYCGNVSEENQNKVKVVADRRIAEWCKDNRAIAVDFVRKPFARYDDDEWYRSAIHVGIYCYRRAALLRYAAAGPCEREQTESLEQLRALHLGMKMGVVLWPEMVHGIDTREDYDAFLKRVTAAA